MKTQVNRKLIIEFDIKEATALANFIRDHLKLTKGMINPVAGILYEKLRDFVFADKPKA